MDLHTIRWKYEVNRFSFNKIYFVTMKFQGSSLVVLLDGRQHRCGGGQLQPGLSLWGKCGKKKKACYDISRTVETDNRFLVFSRLVCRQVSFGFLVHILLWSSWFIFFLCLCHIFIFFLFWFLLMFQLCFLFIYTNFVSFLFYFNKHEFDNVLFPLYFPDFDFIVSYILHTGWFNDTDREGVYVETL